MIETTRNPCFTISAFLLAGLSLSIGWGIRGNYGHELGAMLPGLLTGIAVALLSRREDWRRRVSYFAFFGAVGWGFGGSISYMQVLGYTHSGHLPSQTYGFAGLFLIGFLWAALGGAATALPAVLDRNRLTAMFKPISLLFALWAVLYFLLPWLDDEVQRLQGAMNRHASALYWLDTDWLEVFVVLVGILVYDLCQRRFEHGAALLGYAAVGMIAGSLVQLGFEAAGLTAVFEQCVRYYGDLSVHEKEQLVTNMPNFIFHVTAYIGSGLGLLVGVGAYFSRYGRFRHGASLFLHMAVGWFVGFLVLTVFLDLRLTPPRGDNWAGVVGTFGGSMVYWIRKDLLPVAYASVVCGAIGGLGFSGIACLKLVLVSFGHPGLHEGQPETIASWRHWQSANWHSFLEQSYGFVNGIAVLVALGLLARRLQPTVDDGPSRRWTEVFSLVFVVPVLSYANMVKNLNDWTREYAGHRPLPLVMKAPLFESIELSAWAWFTLFYALGTLVFLFLLVRHLKRPISLLPRSHLGRGQLLYLVVLWSFVLGNFFKALAAFRENRLLTEGVIIGNAFLVTILILLLRESSTEWLLKPATEFRRLLRRAALFAAAALIVSTIFFTVTVRSIYHDEHAGHSGENYRFGPKANAKVKPILRSLPHR